MLVLPSRDRVKMAVITGAKIRRLLSTIGVTSALASLPSLAMAVNGSLNKDLAVALPGGSGDCSLNAFDSGSVSHVGVTSTSKGEQRHAGGKRVANDKVRSGKGGDASKLQDNCLISNVTITNDLFSGANTRNNAASSGVFLMEYSFSYVGSNGMPYMATATLSADTNTGASKSIAAKIVSLIESFERQSPSGSPDTADTATFALVFSGEVTSLDKTDFTTSAGSLSVVGTDGGRSYLITVSGIDLGEPATVGFAASHNISLSDFNTALPTPTATASYQRQASAPPPPPAPLPAPVPSKDAAASPQGLKAASYLIGDLQGRQSQMLYSGRTPSRLSGQASGANAASALQPLATTQDWTAINSDQLWGLMTDHNRAQVAHKLEGLSPESAALIAGLFDDPAPNQGLSLFASQG